MSIDTKSFHVRLVPPRESFPFDMTSEEEALMSRHAEFFRSLVARKIVLLAAPQVEPTCGLAIICAKSLEHARKILTDDPTVKAGLMKIEISPLLSPLPMMAHQVPANRYVSEPSDRILRKTVVVDAPVAEVFRIWTTVEGVKKFFGSDARVELRVGGPYEILFGPEEAAPNRGSEDCHILSFIPNRMFSFEWNAPPEFGDLRYVYTQVVLYFTERNGQTEIELNHLGWGQGAEWDKVSEYFDRAWDAVLGRLVKALGVIQ